MINNLFLSVNLVIFLKIIINYYYYFFQISDASEGTIPAQCAPELQRTNNEKDGRVMTAQKTVRRKKSKYI